MYIEDVVVMDVGRRKKVVKCDVYVQAPYIHTYIYGYIERTEMYNVILVEVKERKNTFMQRDDQKRPTQAQDQKKRGTTCLYRSD
jgi:hypothetical protein